MYEVLILFFAGFIAGAINSLAGGGSFISFPALIFVGVPPISANATNTFAATAGYISGTLGFKEHLFKTPQGLIKITIFSIVGGIVGAWLLLQTSADGFELLIPWLLLFATLLFIYGAKLNGWISSLASGQKNAGILGRIGLNIFLFCACAYGGFFNAGQGIINLAYLSLAGHTNILYMNGIKLLMSAVVGLIAIFIFIFNDLIAWEQGVAVLAGTLIGGYFSAQIANKLNPAHIRFAVICACIGTTIYFFYTTYFV